jgi:hypothetical protein
MKAIHIFFILFLLESCKFKDTPPDLSSFENKWGVICYIEPTNRSYPQRNIFLRFADPADSSAVTDSSSIFDFKYDIGMVFRTTPHSHYNERIYWIDDRENIIRAEEEQTDIYWTFAKIRYHHVGKAPSTGNDLIPFTLFLKEKKLPLAVGNFHQNVWIDTVYLKKKYVGPPIDTTMISKMKLTPHPKYFR